LPKGQGNGVEGPYAISKVKEEKSTLGNFTFFLGLSWQSNW
jgi:hypothetical protein